MGDGVNIAARLEGIAKPGAICLSEDAYRQVKARLNLAVSDLGAIQLKNITEPIGVYSLEVGVAAEAKTATRGEPAALEKPSVTLALPEKPSIAVLPFQNMSGDPVQARAGKMYRTPAVAAQRLCAICLTPSCPDGCACNRLGPPFDHLVREQHR